MLNSLGCDLHVAAARVARVEVLEPAVPVLDGVPQVGGLRRRRAQELLAAVLWLVPKVLGEARTRLLAVRAAVVLRHRRVVERLQPARARPELDARRRQEDLVVADGARLPLCLAIASRKRREYRPIEQPHVCKMLFACGMQSRAV